MAELTIAQLTELLAAGVDNADLLPIWDTTAAETKKITISNFRTAVGVTNWAESFSSATQATSRWIPSNAAANVNAAIVPKGTGAITAAIPDGTTAGGNARGSYAVDLQMIRTVADQVAASNYGIILGGSGNKIAIGHSYALIGGGSGNDIRNGNNYAYTVIVGGQNNVNNSTHSFMGGGLSNTADFGNNYSVIAGGRSNSHGNVNRDYRTICGGFGNVTVEDRGFVGGGQSNSVSLASTIGGGLSNNASGFYASIIGGQSNTASANHSTISGGQTNTVSVTHGFIGGGQGNNVSGGAYNVVVGGSSNTCSGANQNNFVGGGVLNSVSGATQDAVNCGGRANGVSGSYAFNGAGRNNSVSGEGAANLGRFNTVSGSHANVLGGQENTAGGTYAACISSFQGTANLYGQHVHASGRFSANGDAQAHELVWRRLVAGAPVGGTELFLDGASAAAILPATNSVWHGIIDCVAICTATGDGTTVAGDVEATSYKVTIKRIGTATSLVGTVQEIGTTNADASMASGVFTIDNNDTNESLRIVYTSPTTAGSTTNIRCVATFRGTQIQY